MNCQKIKKLLNPYIDKALDTDMAKQVDEHLKSCPTCQDEFLRLKEMVTSLNSLSPQPAPADFTQSIMAKISQKEIQIQTSWMDLLKKRISIPRFSFRLIGAAAVVALVVFLSLIHI